MRRGNEPLAPKDRVLHCAYDKLTRTLHRMTSADATVPGHARKNSGGAYRVRFTPKERTSSGHAGSAAWGHLQTHAPQQGKAYSITSSALASRVGGTVRPSAFAVFRLMISRNLTGC